MMSNAIEATGDAAWLERESIGPLTGGAVREAVDEAIAALDAGSAARAWAEDHLTLDVQHAAFDALVAEAMGVPLAGPTG